MSEENQATELTELSLAEDNLAQLDLTRIAAHAAAKTQAPDDTAKAKDSTELALAVSDRQSSIQSRIKTLKAAESGVDSSPNPRLFVWGVKSRYTISGENMTSQWGSVTGFEFAFNLMSLLAGTTESYNGGSELTRQYSYFEDPPVLIDIQRDYMGLRSLNHGHTDDYSSVWSYGPVPFAWTAVHNPGVNPVTRTAAMNATRGPNSSHTAAAICMLKADGAGGNNASNSWTHSAIASSSSNGSGAISGAFTLLPGETGFLGFFAGNYYTGRTDVGQLVTMMALYDLDALFGADDSGQLICDSSAVLNLIPAKSWRFTDLISITTHSQIA